MSAPIVTHDKETIELLSTLPPVLRAVVNALGINRAKEFLMENGGVNISLPKYHSDTLGISDDELQSLREHLAPFLDSNNRVCMPKVDKIFLRLRRAIIRQERSRLSLKQLAKKHNYTCRHIQNICRESDDNQIDLFDTF